MLDYIPMLVLSNIFFNGFFILILYNLYNLQSIVMYEKIT